jgi:hypothetical protein
MSLKSYVVDEHKGKGHTSHGNGKGLGHKKHQEDAMEDGVYEIDIAGVQHVNPTAVDARQSAILADGSTFFTEVRAGSIQSTDSGLRLQTDSNNGRLRAGVEFDADNRIELGELDSLSFDFTQVTQIGSEFYSPAFRLVIDADGDLSTTNDRGELVFEYAYQNLGDVPIGTTVHADLAGGDWVAWQRSGGANRDQINNMTTFADWSDEDGYTPTNDPDGPGPATAATALHFDADSLVLGFSIGLGSGPGSGVAYVDNVQVAGVTYDFLA